MSTKTDRKKNSSIASEPKNSTIQCTFYRPSIQFSHESIYLRKIVNFLDTTIPFIDNAITHIFNNGLCQLKVISQQHHIH